jgi:hypothetical protein
VTADGGMVITQDLNGVVRRMEASGHLGGMGQTLSMAHSNVSVLWRALTTSPSVAQTTAQRPPRPDKHAALRAASDAAQLGGQLPRMMSNMQVRPSLWHNELCYTGLIILTCSVDEPQFIAIHQHLGQSAGCILSPARWYCQAGRWQTAADIKCCNWPQQGPRVWHGHIAHLA